MAKLNLYLFSPPSFSLNFVSNQSSFLIQFNYFVRSRNFISKGRFICEYVGELLQYKQKDGRIDFNESAYDGAGYSDDEENDKFGNVGRFVRRSCSPNLYAKCVLFNQEDRRMPHVMLFAAKNIPPRKELTFDYKLW